MKADRKALIKARPEVEKIEFQSAEDAWEEYKDKIFSEVLTQQTDLRMTILWRIQPITSVYMNDITKQTELVSYIQSLEHVRMVNQSEEACQNTGKHK